jgi:hypothetical protein
MRGSIIVLMLLSSTAAHAQPGPPSKDQTAGTYADAGPTAARGEDLAHQPPAAATPRNRWRLPLLIAGLVVLGGSVFLGVEAYSSRSRTEIAIAAVGSVVGIGMLGYVVFPPPAKAGAPGISKRSLVLTPVVAPSAAGAMLHVAW